MQQFMEVMQRMTQVQPSRSQEFSIDKNYERVRKQCAKVFMGTTDPAVAEEWLRSIERILDSIECTSEQRLSTLYLCLRRMLWTGGKLFQGAEIG